MLLGKLHNAMQSMRGIPQAVANRCKRGRIQAFRHAIMPGRLRLGALRVRPCGRDVGGLCKNQGSRH